MVSYGFFILISYKKELLRIETDPKKECIVEQYPAQREAFAGYVFIPTTWMIG